MKEITCEIVGISPLLLNRFTDASAIAATEGQRSSANGERLSPEDDAKSRLHVDVNDNPIIPQPMLLASFTAAGTYFKSGRNKISTQRSSLVPATVFLNEPYYPLQSNGGWSVDSRPVRIPATGGRILRYRPIFNDWKVDIEMMVDETLIPLSTIRDIVDAAGSRIGLGDFRPSCRGPYGRFRLDYWDVS